MTKRLTNVPLKDFRDFMKFHGMKRISVKGGHEKWSKKDLTRPVVLQTHIDPIPGFIISNNLRTMGLTTKDLRTFLDD
jgi:hypothetical protein